MFRKFYREITAFVLFLIAYWPTFMWMWARWFSRDSYYSHGILVPFVTIFLIWQKRDELSKLKVQGSIWGFRFIFIGVLIHMVSSLFRIYFSSGFSMIIVLAGLVLYFWGEEAFKKMVFPISFVFFMVPLPMVVVANISFKLKILAAQLAVEVLNGIRIPAIREGSIIRMRDAYVVVDDICSGLRSLISLTALGSIFAYLMSSSMMKRVLLFLSTIPIAIITNMVRVVMLSAITEIWGPQYSTGFIHDLAGFMVFGLAFILLYVAGKILE